MALKCDLCGGTIEMRTGGSAVCTTCGMTYSMESLREKIKASQDNGTPVSAPAATTLSWIPSTLKMAQMHLKDGNPQDACADCDKVLSADFGNSQAWEIKIKASSMPEAAEFFREYYGTATTEDARQRALRFAEDHFASVSGVDGAKTLLDFCPDTANKMVARALKERTDFERKYVEDFKKACNKEQSNRPSRDDRFNRDFDHTIDNVRYVLRNNSSTFDFLDKCTSFNDCKGVDVSQGIIAYVSAYKDYLNAVKSAKRWFATSSTSNRTYLSGQYYVDSSTYSHTLEPIFSSTSWEADAIRSQLDKLSSFERRVNSKLRAERAQKEAEKQARIKSYWDANAERKNELDLEKVKLNASIQRERAELETSPERKALQEAQSELTSANAKLSSLGLFAGKEKKKLNEEILLLKTKISSAQSAYNSKQTSIERKITRIKDRIAEIDKELTLDRDVELPAISTSDEEDYVTRIVLFGPGNNKLKLIKMLQELCELSLTEAKTVADTPNSIFVVPDNAGVFEKVIDVLLDIEADYELV